MQDPAVPGLQIAARADGCEPLEIDDYVGQSMEEASPVKWHLAHTSWFFETFILKASVPD